METQQAPTMPGPGEPIPLPPDFPVEWPQAGDERLFWRRDRMHFPDPLRPLVVDLMANIIYEHCFNYAGERLSFPVHMRPMVQHGYLFDTVVPRGETPEAMEALGSAAQETLMSVMPTIRARWDDEFLPEAQEITRSLQALNASLDGASAAELHRALDEVLERVVRLWEVHFLSVLPTMPAVSIFEEMHRDLLGRDTTFGAHTLLQGADTAITEMGIALWRLSRDALDLSGVRRVLEEEAAADVIPALERVPDGQAFLRDLRAYLDRYGRRSSSAIFLDEVSWIEDPTPVISMLKDYVGQPDRDFLAEQDAIRAERERATAEARERLAGYPEQVRGQFEFLLDAARQAIYVAEEHNFHIDYNAMYEVRRVFLAIGRFLAGAGSLAGQDDIFYLTLDEVRTALDDAGAPDLRPLVRERMAQHARRMALQAPLAIGSMPAGPPPGDPLTTASMKFFGGPPQMPTEPNTVQGTPGSPGVARGTARVLRALREAHRLQPGEIIVAEATATPWTPLFAVAAAIVTDSGGVLSHAAVAAREYGIPAVVGATVATALVRDGQTIEVDGFTGLVRILDPQ